MSYCLKAIFEYDWPKYAKCEQTSKTYVSVFKFNLFIMAGRQKNKAYDELNYKVVKMNNKHAVFCNVCKKHLFNTAEARLRAHRWHENFYNRGMVDELRDDPAHYYIMTKALNQDKLENTFAVVRQKGCNCNNPSVAELNNILATIIR